MKPTLQKLPTHGLWKWATTDKGKTWTTVCYCGWKGGDGEIERHLERVRGK